MTTPSEPITLAEYLGHRLRQAGVDHLFGVPGDFNLTLLDLVTTVPGLEWVGSPNELGAGYAADAYARRRGLAALVTTYGVGELSCLNAVAGSAAEDVPVVHIAGSPATGAVAARRPLHHTLADGVFDRFEKAFAEVTVHQETVTAEHATEQVDAVLLAALTHRRPAYLSIPQDLAGLPVDPAPLRKPLRAAPDEAAVGEFAHELSRLMDGAGRPVLVVGHLVSRFGLAGQVLSAARAANIPLVTTLAAKGAIDASEPLHRGDYAGTMVDASTAGLVDGADLVIELGTVVSDVLSGFFTHRPAGIRTVRIGATSATVGPDGTGSTHPVLFTDAVRVLEDHCQKYRFADQPTADPVPPRHPEFGDDAITQESLWRTAGSWLPSGTAVLADTGTAFWGAVSMTLPDDTVFVGQPVWNSIGYALPATLGQGLADPGRRPVLFIGDGAAQMTIQELSTIARHGLNPVIVLIDNAGYTIERALQSPKAGYNDIAAWDWAGLASSMIGAGRLEASTVRTTDELRTALDAAPADRIVLVHAVLDMFDAPTLLRKLAERNSGSAR
ncbi:alpha-keto acid decarboxylase family protein [Kineosporia sp. J2-2]|uniref:Alpha-keto-acid decarboxylase n=1 Tax=Kineosporia corallincola TaxID=2835133 RepID=A0ABS5TP96_9ACTN|nr:thiamine pyrophosphate-binding protein [Kineosporia corallincola]MBT0772016.1 alpha-keto acid decarboxylase family protein [Kineosporia corallincola]